MTERYWRLDVLRAIAVLFTITHHAGYKGQDLPRPLSAAFQAWHEAGWIGVDLFFVISGYLISGLLFREWQQTGRVRVGRFLIRRGLKIYPAYYVYLSVTMSLWISSGYDWSFGKLVSTALLMQSYGPSLLPHEWSLSVEEHFYLLLAGTFALAVSWFVRRRVFFGIWVAVVLLTLTGRILAEFLGTTSNPSFRTHLRLDSLFAGVAISYCAHFAPRALNRVFHYRRLLWSMVPPLLVLVLLRPHGDSWVRTIGTTMVWMAAAIVVGLMSAPGNDRQPTMPERVAAYLGRHSYSTYLWMLTVMFGIYKTPLRFLDADPTLPHYLGLLVLIFAFGIAVAKIVELPVLRLRDRYFAG